MSRASLVGCMLVAVAARAATIEADGHLGVAFSNIPGVTAPALGARVALDPFDHLAVGVRGFIALGGGPDLPAITDQFSGWAALAEARLHTGPWLAPVRIDVGAAAGVGREIAGGIASLEVESRKFEATRTGITFAGSAALRLNVAPDAVIGIEIMPFIWRGELMTAGTGSAGGPIGALLLLSIGYAR
jgi:hypothetical protein